MRKFYSRTAVVALFAYLFLWPSSAHAQSNYRFGQTLQQLQQEQQIDQFRREQEQDQLQQLNEIPGQPATGMRQLQLNDPQLQLDQLQLEQQQNQLRQETATQSAPGGRTTQPIARLADVRSVPT